MEETGIGKLDDAGVGLYPVSHGSIDTYIAYVCEYGIGFARVAAVAGIERNIAARGIVVDYIARITIPEMIFTKGLVADHVGLHTTEGLSARNEGHIKIIGIDGGGRAG
jgi:hypothetical protein